MEHTDPQNQYGQLLFVYRISHWESFTCTQVSKALTYTKISLSAQHMSTQSAILGIKF